jgi:AcrR family transcriptional regulator
MDRRIQKTRQLIMNTFLSLLNEKEFEKITVNDIAGRANINRGTFYLHYTDKFDLLDKCIEIYVEQLLNHCDNSNETNLSASAFQRLFEYLEKDFEIYSLLLNNGGAGFFRDRLYAAMTQMATDVINIQPENNVFSNRITGHFLASGLIGTLEWWIGNSMPCSIQEITEQLMFLLKPYANHIAPQTH